ncbi:MMPL family transporter [Leifsonia shinshuensis]|uniref:MMPL family transporter n=1 Tax=Leifsonia shinshuensis TaxID=150026 RepID=A0A7G6YDH4_9MICO|nr:MMPL family transporter [Leifsonia shinshuensis]QNE36539.1 MMPL family transporter [Leifsonia shinshuensis]
MSSLLYLLGRAAFRARRRVLVIWLAAFVLLLGGAALLSNGTDNTFTIPGTESQQAQDALARTFPQVSGTSAQLVAVAPKGTDVHDPAFQSAVESSVASIAKIPQVTSASSPYSGPSTGNIAADGSAVIVPIQLSVAQTAVLPSTSDALQRAGRDLEAALPKGSEVAVGGQLFSQTVAGISVTELLGIVVAFAVLIATFASVIAASLPLITALLGAGLSLSLIFAATHWLTIASTTPLLALMLGLAVGIDYALFIISRHQEQLKHGMAPEESAARAVATAGSAVVFAAVTVIIALVGLSVAGIPFLTTMGVAAALAVTFAVLISMTLTPALLGFAGMRVVAKRYRGDAGVKAPSSPVRHPIAGFWVRLVTRIPILTVVLVVALLGLVALPAASLRLALPDAGSLDEHEPARIAYDLIAEHFGPGYNGPLIATGSVIGSTDPVGLMNDLGAELETVPGVAAVPLSTPNETGDTGIAQVVPTGAPDSEATQALVAKLRSMHDHFQREYGIDLSITGYTAAGIDISSRLGGALLPFALLVVGLSLVLLAIVFRSIVVPVTAALGYLLSIGAAFGVTSLVFMSGWLAGPLGVAHIGSVISFMPIIVMGVLFGLAMDYEVFLASRMREEHILGADTKDSVHRGFQGSAKVVTAAAVIMFAVFAAFIPGGDAQIQPIALGLAVGVAVDAFVVRMTLIPAVLVLFGRATWWMPRSWDRALPVLDIEGEGVQAELDATGWPEPGTKYALAADGARAGGSGALDALVPPGGAIVVTGPGHTALALAIAGRAPLTAGRLKVDGLLLPVRRSSVRSRAGVARLDRAADAVAAVRDAADGRPAVVVVDGAEAVVGDERRALAGELQRVADAGAAVVLAATTPEAVADLLPVVRTAQPESPAETETETETEPQPHAETEPEPEPEPEPPAESTDPTVPADATAPADPTTPTDPRDGDDAALDSHLPS